VQPGTGGAAAAALRSTPSDTPADAGAPTDPAAATPATAEPVVAAEIDRQAAAGALNGAAATAAGCRTDGSEGTVPVTVSVTFAPSGRVTTANIIGGAFAGTSTGGCIARAFKGARVPAFGGGPVTVHKTVLVR
jgi:hypothetical protein